MNTLTPVPHRLLPSFHLPTTTLVPLCIAVAVTPMDGIAIASTLFIAQIIKIPIPGTNAAIAEDIPPYPKLG